eukprot:33817_1
MLRMANVCAPLIRVSKCNHNRALAFAMSSSNKEMDWKQRLANTNENIDDSNTETLYNNWTNDYDQSVTEWGYQIPLVMANLIKTHLETDARHSKALKVFDLGCGTGLIGEQLISTLSDINVTLCGADLSNQQFQITKQRGYHQLKQMNLNEFPFPYGASEFDVLTCGGVLTYSQDKHLLFEEWVRIAKQDAIICCSHRTDLLKQDMHHFDKMEKDGKWTCLHITEPFPYLPNNENYGTDILVQCYLAKAIK